MSIEVLISLFALIGVVLVFIVSKNSEKKRQGFSQVRSFLDHQMKEIINRIDMKKSDLEKTMMSIETILNKANAISRIVEDNIDTTESRLQSLQESEKSINLMHITAEELKQFIQSLMNKVEDVKQYDNHINLLQDSINDVGTQCTQVKKNLDNIQDIVGKSLSDKNLQIDKHLQNYLGELETKINNWVKEIYHNNQERVAEITNQAQDALSLWIDKNADIVNKLIGDVKETEEDIRSIKDGFTDSLNEEVSSKLKDLDHYLVRGDSFLKEHESYFNNLRNSQEHVFKENFEKIVGTFSQNYKEFKNELGTLTKSYHHEIEELNENAESLKQQFFKFVEQESRGFDKKINALEGSLQKVDSIASEQENKIRRSIDNKINEIEENLNQEIRTIHGKVQNAEVNVKDILDKFSNKITNEMDDMVKEIDKNRQSITSDYKQVENKITSFGDNMESTIHSKVREMVKMYETGKEDVERKLNSLQSDVSSSSDRLKEQLKSDIMDFKAQIESQREGLNADKKFLLQDLKQSVDQYIVEAQDRVIKIEEKLKKNEENQLLLDSKIKNFIEDKLNDVENFIQEQRLYVSDEMKGFDEVRNTAEEKVRDYFSERQFDIQQFIESQTSYFKRHMDDLIASRNSMEVSFTSDMSKIKEETKVTLAHFERDIQSKTEEIDALKKTSSLEINSFIEKCTSDVQNFLSRYGNVDEKLYSFLEEKNKEIEIFINSQKNSINNYISDVNKIKDSMETTFDSKVKEIETKTEKLESHQKELLENYKEELMQFNEKQGESVTYTLSQKSIEVDNFIHQHRRSFDEESRSVNEKIKRYIEEFYENSTRRLNELKEQAEGQKDNIIQDMKVHLINLGQYKQEIEREIRDDIFPSQQNYFLSSINEIKILSESKIEDMEKNTISQIEDVKSGLSRIVTNYDKKMEEIIIGNFHNIADIKEKSQQQIESFIGEEKSKIEDISRTLDDSRYNLESEVRKNRLSLQANFEEISEQVRSSINMVEQALLEKEKSINDRITSHGDMLGQQLEDLSHRVMRLDSMYHEELSKTTNNIKDDLYKLQADFEDHSKKIIQNLNNELTELKDNVEKTKNKLGDINQEGSKDLKEKLKSLEQDFQSSVIIFEKDLNAKRGNVETLISNKQEEMMGTVDSLKGDIEDISRKLGQYKNDKKLSKVMQELADLDVTMKRIERQREIFSDVEKNHHRIKKEVENVFSEIGKFDAKKNEVENLNTRINQTIIRAKEADERIELFNKKSAEISQIEAKINHLNKLYDQLQEKSKIIESKEERLTDMIQKIEINNSTIGEINNEINSFKIDVEKGFKKTEVISDRLQQISLQLEEVKSGEDKIDDILSRFSEVEGLSQDIQSRLKQLSGANDRLDLAEARIRNLLGIIEDPQTIDKANKKQGMFSKPSLVPEQNKATINSGQKVSQAKKDAIFRYKSNGFTEDVIANILEMTSEEVSDIIKDRS